VTEKRAADMGKKARLLFIGTPEFAIESLRVLLEGPFEVVGVVTQPDRPKGRGREPAPPPVKRLALEKGVRVYQPENVNSPDFIEKVKSLKVDLIVVVSFGKRLSKRLLEVPPLGCWNLHASLLPKYRGAAPVAWALVRGEKMTGVSIMKMEPSMDTGPVAATATLPILPGQNAGELEKKLSGLGARLLVKTLTQIVEGKVKLHEQDEAEATYAPKLKKSDGRINWNLSPQEIVNFIYGMNPWPGAYSILSHSGKSTRITVLDAVALPSREKGHARCGRIILASEEGIEVACKGGSVLLKKIQPAGKKAMSVADYLRGHSISLGDRFVE